MDKYTIFDILVLYQYGLRADINDGHIVEISTEEEE